MVRNRGQLLLIAAILIGITIISAVVMLNGMQQADAVASQSQSNALDDAERTEEMVDRDMNGLVEDVLNSSVNNETALQENISVYNNYTRNMSASRGASSVIVELNESKSDFTDGPIYVDYRYRSEKLAYDRTIEVEVS